MYPAMSKTDDATQQFAQMLGGYKPNQLGAGVTLGNEEGQQDYARQLAEALAQQQAAESGMAAADRLSQAEYVPNSGILGSLAMVAQRSAARKIRGKESASQADAMARGFEAKAGMEEKRAGSERSRRSMVAQQLELTKREAAEFIETGKIPEAKRDHLQAVQSDQGFAIINNDAGTYRIAQPEDAQPEGYKVTYAPGASAEDRAAVDAAARAAGWPSDPHGDVVDVGRVRPQQGRPLIPYEKPRAPKFQSRQFTPAEVARMGLPAGTVAYSTEDGSPKIVNKPNAIPGGQTQVIDNGDGTRTIIPAGKTTEDQNKAAGWYASSTNALKNLRGVLAKDPSAIFPGVIETYAPGEEIKQRSMSPTRQQAAHAFDTMKMDFLHAATGAGFTKEEASDEWRNLAPQRGDDAPLVNQKLRQIEVKLEAMHRRAGGAAPQTAPQGNAAQPDGSPTQRIRIKL